MSKDIIVQILGYLIPVLVPAIAAYLAAVILRRIPDRRLAQALTLVDYLASGVVAEIYQKTVADLKDPTKPGTWNDVAAATAKRTAMEQLRVVGANVISTVVACGMSPASVDGVLSQAIEKAVIDLNTRVEPPFMRRVLPLPWSEVPTTATPSTPSDPPPITSSDPARPTPTTQDSNSKP